MGLVRSSIVWGRLGVFGLLLGSGLLSCSPADPRPADPRPADPRLSPEEPIPQTPPVASSEDPRKPRFEVAESLLADLEAKRHPSDGQGTAVLELVSPEEGLRAGRRGRLRLRLEVGELGIAVDGGIYLQISPFWGWSTPQVEDRRAPGFSEIATDAEGVFFEAKTLDQQLLVARVKGRPLRAGERVWIDFGAGSAGARVDRFAEAQERIWLAVDGDGDGVRKLVDQPPTVDIGPGPGARAVAFLPSIAAPGEAVALHVSVLDSAGNAAVEFEGSVRIDGRVPTGIEDGPAWRHGTAILTWTAGQEGWAQLRVTVKDERSSRRLQTLTNPMLVAPAAPQIYWADLQVHSNRSDGTGLPEDLYRYGRDVARLDVMAVTDHDHWGLRFLDTDPQEWARIQEVTETFHEPGRFVTVRGFEWTHWIHGHRHVLVFDGDPLRIFSSLDPSFDHPTELWAALEGRQALTIAHHSAGGPIATDWSIAPDPVLEPTTEIVSVHGSSEAMDSPRLIYRPVPGNFVRDGALGRGYRLGFIGSTDGHDGHPGLAHLTGSSGGLGAILADSLTREDVLTAIRRRATYATSGPRILLRVLLAGYRMGAELPVADGKIQIGPDDDRVPLKADTLWLQAIGHEPMDRIDIIRGQRVERLPCDQRECSVVVNVGDFKPGEFLYVRAVQTDGHFAVSSPFYFVEP